MIYVVLGMHKSGTTLVSEILHRSGVRMGEGRDVDGEYDDGVFFERSDVRELNQAILGFGDPAHTHPAPRRLAAAEPVRLRMREIIRKAEAPGGDWGFKDPRTCLTYPLWREELPAHRLIGVVRSLPEVASHYRRKDPGPFLTWRVVRTWCDYNEGILRALEQARGDGVLLAYEELMRSGAELARLSAFVGRPLRDTRNSERYRSRASGGARLALTRLLRRGGGRSDPARIARALASARAHQLDGPER